VRHLTYGVAILLPIGFVTPALAEVVVIARSIQTGAIGVGRGPYEAEASADAINKCYAADSQTSIGTCKAAAISSSLLCVALAVRRGDGRSFGGWGNTEGDAENNALVRCGAGCDPIAATCRRN
jgi:hypothetical protein